MRVRLATHVASAATVTRLSKHDAHVQRHLPSTPSSSDVSFLFSWQPKVSITMTDQDKSARGLLGVGRASSILLEVSAGQPLQTQHPSDTVCSTSHEPAHPDAKQLSKEVAACCWVRCGGGDKHGPCFWLQLAAIVY